MNSYTSNLERKGRSGRAGVITEFMPGVSLGLAYNRHKNDFKEYNGVQLGSGIGSVKSKSNTDSLSAVVSLTPEKTGFIGHLASCYGWGTVKNTRRCTYAGNEVSSKGKPNISMSGGLVQLGYNLKLSSVVSLIPYTECLFSVVRWSSYEEKYGLLPCKISRNQEKTIEYSFGLRNYWEMGNGLQLQGWVAGIAGKSKTNSLTSKPIMAPIDRYTAHVPVLKKRYTRAEVGLAYEAKLTDTLNLGLNGSIRFENVRKSDSQNISFNLQYTY